MLYKKRCNCRDVPPPLEKQLEYIMENFDFDHVHEMMKWSKARREYDENGKVVDEKPWYVVNHKTKWMEIPDVDELKHMAKEQLNSAIEFHKNNPRNPFWSTHCGPFKTEYRWGILELMCIFEDWSYD